MEERNGPRMTDVSGIARKFLDVRYGADSPNQRLDVLLPEVGSEPFPALIYVHGGGFAFGDKRDEHLAPYLAALARGWAVVSVEYRLSGEVIFPAAVLDVRSAVRFVRAHAAEYGIDPEKLASIGGSAGGNLAAMLGMNVPNGAFPGESGTCGAEPFVDVAVDQFGPMDFRSMDDQAHANGVSFADHDLPDSPESRYLGAPVPEAPEELCAQANPLHYAGAAMAPMLVQHGTRDRLVAFQQSEEFVAGLRARGLGERVRFTPIDGADHDGPEFWTAENMALVLDFIEEAWKRN